jgi:hypothetical protein
MSMLKTIATRTAAGLAAAGLAAGLSLAAAGPASAYDASYAKPHDIYGSITEHCHQNNIFAPADKTKTQSFYTFIAAGLPNGQFHDQYIQPDDVEAGNIYCGSELRMWEKDSSGTMHVRASTGGIWRDWLGEHTFNKTMEFDLAPNQTKSFKLTATSGGGDYDAASFTVTNQVL